MAVVGAPSYFRKRSEPKTPQDLIGHSCINLRLPTHGGLYAWEFEKGGRELKVRVEGQLVFNGTYQMLNAALAGFGLAYVPENLAQPHLAKGRLRRVLDDWCPPFSGYHLYYPSRRQSSRRPSPCSSMRCAIELKAEGERRQLWLGLSCARSGASDRFWLSSAVQSWVSARPECRSHPTFGCVSTAVGR